MLCKQLDLEPRMDPSSSFLVIVMYKPTTSYDSDLPPLEERTIDRAKMIATIHNLVGIDIERHLKTITNAKAIPNWQSEIALTHNKFLQKIEHKVDAVNTNINQVASSFTNKVNGLKAIVQELRRKIDALHHMLQTQAMQY